MAEHPAKTVPLSRNAGDVVRVMNGIRSKLLGRYPRVTRSLALSEVPEDEERFYPSVPGYVVGKINAPPVDGYVEVDRLRLNEILAVNELQCYRMLKRTYGRADITAAFANVKENTAHPYDWGYCVRIHDAALVEIQRQSHNIFLVMWGAEGTQQEKRREAGAALGRFISDLTDSIRKSKLLFDARSEVRGTVALAGVQNPFFEKYSAGQELLRLAIDSDKPRKWTRVKRDEPGTLPVTGSVYLAAITYFYIALEAFENLVRSYFLKKKYRNQEQIGEILKVPIEDRLTRMTDYCDGFLRNPVEAHSELHKRLRPLRRLRNQVIHGLTPEDLNTYALSEDGFVFMYSAEQDEEHKAGSDSYLPISRLLVRRHNAEYVKALVDETITAVIDALAPLQANTAGAFRDDPLLQRASDGRIGPLDKKFSGQ